MSIQSDVSTPDRCISMLIMTINIYVCYCPPFSIPYSNHEAVGFQPQEVDSTDLGSFSYTQIHFQAPLRQRCMPVTRQNKRRTENWTSIGHQCEQLDLRGSPIKLGSYVIQLFYINMYIIRTKIAYNITPIIPII